MTTISPTQQSILRILADGPLSTESLQKRLTSGPESWHQALENSHAAGLVKRSGRIWHITAKGRRALPPRAVTLPQTTYVPPRVYRRAGSCHRHIPSHYGNAR